MTHLPARKAGKRGTGRARQHRGPSIATRMAPAATFGSRNRPARIAWSRARSRFGPIVFDSRRFRCRHVRDCDHPSNDYTPVIAALASRERPHLETLVVDGFGGGALQARSVVGDLSAIWKALPALQTLTIFGLVSRLGTVTANTLRELSLTVPELETSLVRELTNGQWPALEALTLHRWAISVDEKCAPLECLTWRQEGATRCDGLSPVPPSSSRAPLPGALSGADGELDSLQRW
jgi:hypothetical protein